MKNVAMTHPTGHLPSSLGVGETPPPSPSNRPQTHTTPDHDPRPLLADEAMCGCAQRCLRVVDSWYHAITGSTAPVKFSELDQAEPLAIV